MTMKITLNHPDYKNLSENNQKQRFVQSQNLSQSYDDIQKQKINKNNVRLTKNYQIEYINGQYYGQMNLHKQPYGSGIFIDDEFNFFMSNWIDNKKMNGLTFIKLINDITIYGSWINGQINGYNVVKQKQFTFYIQSKRTHQTIWFSSILIVNELVQIAYLLNIDKDSNDQNMRFEVIDRKYIKNYDNFSKNTKSNQQNQNKVSSNPNLIFQQYQTKIPSYLFNIQKFFIHLNQFKQQFIIKQFLKDNRIQLFITIQPNIPSISKKQYQQNKQETFSHSFKEKFGFNKSNLKQKSNSKKLGLVINKDTLKSKSIGNFNDKTQLNGIGLSFNGKQAFLGLFNKNLLTKQLKYEQQFISKQFFNKNLKKTLTHSHLTSLNFQHDMIYFPKVFQIVSLVQKIIKYINIFEKEYSNKYQNSQNSSQVESQKEYQNKYILNNGYIQNKENLNIHHRDFVKRNDILLNTNYIQTSKRPYGRIVNSRSPLRNLSKNNSKSPSQKQTFRKTYHHHHQNKSQRHHYEDIKTSIDRLRSSKKLNIQTSFPTIDQSLYSKYNQETQKNKEKFYLNLEYKRDKRYFRRNITQIQQPVVETVRRNYKMQQKGQQHGIRNSPNRQIYWKK